MPISDLHSEYEDYSIQWKRIRDCVAGEDAVKASGQMHLPKPDNMLPDQYANYITRALFYGATGRTLAGLVGAIFRKRPIVQVPDKLRENLFNITGTGVPFDNFAQFTVEETLSMGRFAVLVDRPAEIEGNPYLRGYRAEEITNWRTDTIEGEEKLVQCILKETWKNWKEQRRPKNSLVKVAFRVSTTPNKSAVVETWWQCELVLA